MEHQREVHSEERALWHTERAELHEKIAQLDATLRRYQTLSSSQISSPVDKNGTNSHSSFWGLLNSTEGSGKTSASGTGDEIWRGPKTDVEPTRTFSDSSNQSVKTDSRLPSISEDITPRGRKESSGDVPEKLGAPRIPSISGAQIDKNLDGINFKSSSLAPPIVRKVMTPQSPSPQSPSPSKVSPGTISLPPATLGQPEEMNTKHAGHTPLARRTYFNTDGASSNRSSDTSTPKQPETERPPLEPHVSTIKVPSERSNSYFPAAAKDSVDGNPELTGPLSLTNDESGDKQFLSELDSKLSAARSKMLDSPTVAGALEDQKPEEEQDDREFEQPEHEPKLRIKRSMNFGSAFGAKTLGKGL